MLGAPALPSRKKGKVLQATLENVTTVPMLDITCLESKVMGSESAQKTEQGTWTGWSGRWSRHSKFICPVRV